MISAETKCWDSHRQRLNAGPFSAKKPKINTNKDQQGSFQCVQQFAICPISLLQLDQGMSFCANFHFPNMVRLNLTLNFSLEVRTMNLQSQWFVCQRSLIHFILTEQYTLQIRELHWSDHKNTFALIVLIVSNLEKHWNVYDIFIPRLLIALTS